MKFLSTVLTSSLLVAAVQASINNNNQHDQIHSPSKRNSDHALLKERRRAMVEEYMRSHPDEHYQLHERNQLHERKAKSCKNKKSKNTTKVTNKATKHESNKKSDSKKSDSKKSDSKKSSSSKSDDSSSDVAGNGNGLFGMKFKSACSPDASKSHPNGAQNFLNCGVDGNGWNPPDVKLSDLKYLSASEAAKSAAFKPCAQYEWAFKDAEKNHGVPATLLMSFAMQESTCNPKVTGGNGEQGMMQITPDKCGGAPDGNCKDVWFNVDAGAKYFKSVLNDSNNNVLLAIGSYNGWSKGLTVGSATAAAKSGNCHAQNNLDYVFQMLNGWLVGASNPYDMGQYQNLKNCD